MGQMQQQVTSLEGARAAGKSVVKDAHDTQQSGIKQNFKQNVTNQHVSGTVKSESGVPADIGFGQLETGKGKKY
jgi:hypothetical protein